MAWVEKRKAGNRTSRYRMREKIDGRSRTIIRDLGTNKGVADRWNAKFDDALALGFTFKPPITVTQIREYLEAKAAGRDRPDAPRILISAMCDLYLAKFGPSLKGGVNPHYHSPYNILRLRLEQLKRSPAQRSAEGAVVRTWGNMYADEINIYHVRDLLAGWKTVGTRMRNLGAFGAMFRAFAAWNDAGNVLPHKVRMPSYNPFSTWRSQYMKSSEKREHIDTRVLSKEQWDDFKVHLTIRARQICEIALQRFLRLADIRRLTEASQTEDAFETGRFLKGTQEKTGETFLVPLIKGHPVEYDFTNFRRDFMKAQEKAEMLLPASHALHFSVKDLRRTGATWAYRETQDIVTISKMLGHRKLSTTQRYLNVDQTDLYKLAKTMDEIVDRKNRATST